MKIPRKILVIITRRLGDVLLATPLIRTIREAWPAAAIDVLVFKGTEGIIVANPDIRNVITVEEHCRTWPHLKFLPGLVRRYDIALSTINGDRPVFYAWLAGKYSVGFIPGEGIKHFWKRCLLSNWLYAETHHTHTVINNLRLAQLLGLPLHPDVIVTWGKNDESHVRSLLGFDINSQPFAVIHMQPRYRYKEWSKKGWIALAQWLREQGLHVVFTGGDSEDEKALVKETIHALSGRMFNMIGRLSLSEIGFLLSQARVYVGPDTVMTHMAAALGIPTVALYGPTNPVVWGPWPKDHTLGENPYIKKSSQNIRHVFLVQGDGDCVPCHKEGCDRHLGSLSKCLQDISPEKLIAIVRQALEFDKQRELSN